ncbi:MAG: hypothetical protein AAGF27_10110 [Pseudomonadota bacterium]
MTELRADLSRGPPKVKAALSGLSSVQARLNAYDLRAQVIASIMGTTIKSAVVI